MCHFQHRFMSCLTNLISFHDEDTHLADQGKLVDVVVWDFSKVWILSPTLHFQAKCVMCCQNWLSDYAQRIIVNGVTSGWLPAGLPRAKF